MTCTTEDSELVSDSDSDSIGDKLAYILGDRYLSSEDSRFVDLVITDLEDFQAQSTTEFVLLFPPVNNYLRLLIHKTVEDFKDLHSFSVGEDNKRQTVVCWSQSLINREQDITSVFEYPRPQGMRGRGRGRLKDRNSPCPSPGNRYGSENEVGRLGHDIHEPKLGSTAQKSAFDQSESLQGTRQQRLGLPCQQNDVSSRGVKHPEARTTSPGSGDGSSPNRARKSERSKNRRPDVQVYVPRARRQPAGSGRTGSPALPNKQDSDARPLQAEQNKGEIEAFSNTREPTSRTMLQTSQNEALSQRPCDSPDERPRLGTARQRKKEIEHYVPRGRREKLDKYRAESTSADGPDVNRVKSESPSSMHKKIKVTDDISDKPTSLDRTTDSWCSYYLNEVENGDNESQGDRACVHKDNLNQISNKSQECQIQEADVPVIQNTSKHKHIAVDIKELDTENCASFDEFIPKKNINPEDKVSQNVSTCPVESSSVKADSFIPTSNVVEGNITTVDLVSDSSATNLPKSDVSFASRATNFKESQVVNSQSFEHNQALTKNVYSDNFMEDVVKLNNSGDRIHTETAENTACTDVNKTTVNSLGNIEVQTNSIQSEDPDLHEIGHSEMGSNKCDMKVNDDSNTNEMDEKLCNLDNTNEITKSTLNSDVVKCPKVFTDLQKYQIDFDYSAHKVREVMPEVDIDPPELRDCDPVNLTTESAVSEDCFHFNEVRRTNNSNEKMSEICVVETDNQSAETDRDNTKISDDSVRDTEGIGEHDSLSAEPMETTDSSNIHKEQKETKGQDLFGSSVGDLESTNKAEPGMTDISQSENAFNSNCQPEEEKRKNYYQSNETSVNMDMTKVEAVEAEQQSDVTLNSSQSKEEEEDEDSWDKMFDDDGECLDPAAIEALTKTVGKVKIKKSKKINYLEYQPKDKSNFDFTQYEHIIEIYDFPAEFVTRDLIIAFQEFMSRGFDLKWVDDTHALGIFSSAIAAGDALRLVHPLLKVCPLSQASKQSQMKARRCTEFLQPYKPRPETSAMAARRLVAGALGIATGVSKEKREKERQQLREAKAKKRQEKQNRENIWDYGRCAMDEET